MTTSTYKNKEQGFTLFYAVLVTSLLLSLGLAVFNITLKELILSSDARESQNALYAADAALECTLYWDNSGTPPFGFYGDSLASGITNYWRFDEGDDADVFDTGSGNNDGLLLPDDIGPTWVSGYVNDALSFDGVDDYVGLENTASYEDAFTIAFWAQPVAPTAGNQMVLRGPTGGFGFRAGSQFRVIAGGTAVNVNGATGFGSWTHYVLRREDDNDVEIIIDGSTTITVGNLPGTFSIDYIGQFGGTNFYNGLLDDVRIYNRELSDEEIDAMYNGEANNIFAEPYEQMSNILCAGADISDPETGWDEDESGDPIGWDTVTDVDSAITTFDMSFEDGRCAYVTVSKDTSTTTIVARGYNSCTEGDTRRVERALRAEY